jgi:hypothetical protein
MRVFFDENIPRQLRHALEGHHVSFAESEGWKGKENGDLLSLVENRFDVLITSDANLPFQQNLSGRNLSIIILPTNKLTPLRANAVALKLTLDQLAELPEPALIVIDWKGRRTMRTFDQASEEIELPPVMPYKL